MDTLASAARLRQLYDTAKRFAAAQGVALHCTVAHLGDTSGVRMLCDTTLLDYLQSPESLDAVITFSLIPGSTSATKKTLRWESSLAPVVVEVPIDEPGALLDAPFVLPVPEVVDTTPLATATPEVTPEPTPEFTPEFTPAPPPAPPTPKVLPPAAPRDPRVSLIFSNLRRRVSGSGIAYRISEFDLADAPHHSKGASYTLSRGLLDLPRRTFPIVTMKDSRRGFVPGNLEWSISGVVGA
jgi:hypothetical protein